MSTWGQISVNYYRIDANTHLNTPKQVLYDHRCWRLLDNILLTLYMFANTLYVNEDVKY